MLRYVIHSKTELEIEIQNSHNNLYISEFSISISEIIPLTSLVSEQSEHNDNSDFISVCQVIKFYNVWKSR